MPDLPMPKRLSAAQGFGRRGFAQAGLIWHPEGLESTEFRLELIPMKIGAGMTTFLKTVVYGQTRINPAGKKP